MMKIPKGYQEFVGSLPRSYDDCRIKNPGWMMETLAEATELGNACVRGHKRLGLGLWRVEERLECQKAPNFWIKTPFAQNPIGCTGTL